MLSDQTNLTAAFCASFRPQIGLGRGYMLGE